MKKLIIIIALLFSTSAYGYEWYITTVEYEGYTSLHLTIENPSPDEKYYLLIGAADGSWVAADYYLSWFDEYGDFEVPKAYRDNPDIHYFVGVRPSEGWDEWNYQSSDIVNRVNLGLDLETGSGNQAVSGAGFGGGSGSVYDAIFSAASPSGISNNGLVLLGGFTGIGLLFVAYRKINKTGVK